MSQEVRGAMERLLARLDQGPVTLLGAPGPSRMLLDRARRAGALEVAEGVPPTRHVAVPMTGLPDDRLAELRRGGHEVLDLTLASTKRTKAMIRLLRLEQRQVVLVGCRGDAECETLASCGATVVSSVDEAMALPFSPRFGVVSQSHIGGERLRSVVAALRRRHPDSSLVVMDTRDPEWIDRERAVISLARETGRVVVVADPGDPSGRGLYEAARLAGAEVTMVETADQLAGSGFAGAFGLTAGMFTPEDAVQLLR